MANPPPPLHPMIRYVEKLSPVLLCILAACTDAVTIPSNGAGAPGPHFTAGDAGTIVLGSSTISFPSPDWTYVSLLPDSQWVIVDVEGTTTYTKNSECEQLSPAWRWTNFPLHGLVAGPLKGPVYVRVGSGPNSQNTLWPVNGTAETATHARMLTFAITPGTSVGAYYTGGVGSCGNPTAGIYYRGYHVSGSHEITVTRIPAPMEIKAPEKVVKNAVAEFSVQPYGDLRWLNPSGVPLPQGRRSWYYFPGDTVGEPSNSFVGPFVSLTHCWDKPTCEYQPQVSGRMLVSGYVEGRGATWKSEIVRVVDSELELTCPETVERGSEMTCTAQAAPSGTAEIIGWEFVADGMDYRNPTAGASPFTGTVWKGPMVVGGTVTVRGRIAGREEAKSAHVVVTPRDWSSRAFPAVAVEEPIPDAETMPTRPVVIQQLGHIHNLLTTAVRREHWEPIFAGPNANLAYLVDVPVSYRGSIHVNRTALAVGSDFWNAQYTRQRSADVVDCLRREEDIVGFIPVILRHEGVGFDPKSHAFLFREAVQRVGNSRFEAVIGASLQELVDQADGIARVAGDSASVAANLADTPGYAPQWCRFNFNYTGR